MVAIVYDYKEVGRVARSISRSFDWYPNLEKEQAKKAAKPVSSFRRVACNRKARQTTTTFEGSSFVAGLMEASDALRHHRTRVAPYQLH